MHNVHSFVVVLLVLAILFAPQFALYLSRDKSKESDEEFEFDYR